MSSHNPCSHDRRILDGPASILIAALAVLPASAAQPQLTLTQLTTTGCVPGGDNFYASVDSTGKLIAFESYCDLVPGSNLDENGEVFVMNADGTGLKQLTFTSGCGGISNPAIDPGGHTVAFVAWDCDVVPGGNPDGNAEIYLIKVDGTGLTQVTSTTGGDPEVFGGNSHPRPTPGGEEVAFSSDLDLVPGSNADGNHELFLVDGNGANLRQLTSTTGGYGVFDLGGLDKTGKKVIFDSDRDLVPGGNADGNSDVFVMNVDGTGLVQVTSTSGPGDSIAPRWTPSAKTFAFRTELDLLGNNPDGNFEVYRQNVDGTGLVQVTHSNGGFGSVAWGITGDGKTMAVSSDRDLVPGSNADQSFEVYLVKLKP